jgi:Mn2+ and Fe2+ transporters of the NRAMP family
MAVRALAIMTTTVDRGWRGLRQSLGPGILLAGACIGGSHLMSSTTAGARFGFALVGLILLTNLLKYPFLLVGSRFTAATGQSLLEGFLPAAAPICPCI